jgi:DNA-binding response OmpR family regulator
MPPMKILVIDRDAQFAALMAFALEQASYEICLAPDRTTALRHLLLENPDLALLDHSEDLDCIEICRELRARSELPIIVLSDRGLEEDLVAAIDAGADDFLRKPFSPRVLLARVKALLRRSEGATSNVVTAARLQLARDELTLRIGACPEIHLTPNECSVLALLMSTPGRTVPSERLLAHVWGDSSRSTQQMLKQLIYRLRQKLEADPAAPQLIVTTPGAGYRLVIEPQTRDQPTASVPR